MLVLIVGTIRCINGVRSGVSDPRIGAGRLGNIGAHSGYHQLQQWCQKWDE